MKPQPQPSDPPTAALSAAQQAQVRATLERILASPAFRNSRQCQKFLQYVLEHSLSGEEDLLRERIIGIQLFGRAPDYDTGEDPVVRVRATEVRKRLAQYHGEETAPAPVRFEMPSGSYRAEFHWAPEAVRAEAAPSRKRRRLAAGLALVVVLVVAVAASLFWQRPSARPGIDRFWAPAMASPKPVLIYCGQPVVYFLSKDIHDRYRATLPAEKQKATYALVLPPDETLRGRDIIPVTDQFVGIGNAHSAALLAAMFAGHRKQVEIRYANDVSFTDLRSSPTVLVGAFSNLWTMEMTAQLRFVFEQENGLRRIRDRSNGKTWQLQNQSPDGKTPEDFALVSRLIDSATGQLLISAAGITQYGTRIAGEFLTDPTRLNDALRSAPAEWPAKNVQVLLQTNVYKGTPGPPKVLTVHVW